MKLIVTIDTEEDAGPGWVSPPTSSFLGVTEGLQNRLQPIFKDLGVSPTLMISPIVMQDRVAVDTLGNMDDVELAAHLHWEQIGPHQERTVHGGPQLLRHMQTDFPPTAEREKLEALTELFIQQFGQRPTSFRAGRYGLSPATGALLQQLGYEADASVTPHVNWQSPEGRTVDYSQLPENPYYIGADGNIFKPGKSSFLEIPITIIAPQLMGLQQAPWLRPGYSTLAAMKEMVRIVRERNAMGIEQPLVMMFHNVEVIPNASPYTKTEDEVRAYLDSLRGTLEYALSLGFEPTTLTGYAREFDIAQAKAQPRYQAYQVNTAQDRSLPDNGIGIPSTEVRRSIDRHNVPPWHLYIYRERNTRWDVVAISNWVNDNIPKNGAILSVGCGMAFNLYWWARQGYTDLHGCDRDTNAIEGSKELIRQHNLPINLWVADARKGDHGFENRFDYIEAMNCLMYADRTYARFLKAYSKALKPGGYLALDVIDVSFNQMPNNQWLSSDLGKPVDQRAPSEYKVRLSEKEIVEMALQQGLALQTIIKNPQYPQPRFIYIFRKTLSTDTPVFIQPPKSVPTPPPSVAPKTDGAPRKPHILFCVDVPGWAHDFKTTNVIKQLGHRFDCRKVFDQQMTRDDMEWADVVIVYYWKQFNLLHVFSDVLRRKIVLTGICCHTDLEGADREIGINVLKLFQGVFVHNQFLHDEYAPIFADKPFYLNPNGVDTGFYSPAATPRPAGQPLVAGWAGSLSNHGNKRGYHDILVPAIEATPGVVLHTAAREDKWRGPQEMLEFYRDLDVYLVGSRVEGTPNPGLEAAACGVPVISTRVGNMPQLISDGINGFLVDHTPEAFAERLAQLRDDPDLLLRMKAQIRQDIKEWDWENKAQNFGNMIADALARYHWQPS